MVKHTEKLKVQLPSQGFIISLLLAWFPLSRRLPQSDAIILLCNTLPPMETAALKYRNSLQQSATLYDPRTIDLLACCCYCTTITGKKMAAFNEESLAFLEEVRKYDCLYNKFNMDIKNKFKKYNCWVEISEKCGMSAEDCEKKFRNMWSSYGRMLKKEAHSVRIWSRDSE